MNWLHACYSLGATLGPLAMTAVIVRLGNWRLGYAAVGAALAAMAGLFLLTRCGWNDPVSDEASSNGERSVTTDAPAVGLRRALGKPLVRLQIVLFFLYVGLEFTVGQWCFTNLTESRAEPPEVAGLLAGGYYLAIGVGRVAAGVVAHRIGLDRLLRLSMCLVIAGTGLYAFAGPPATGMRFDVLGLILVGLGLAPIFPVLMTRTPQRLGAETATHAVGFQVSAGMLGAALVPGLAGLVAERGGLEWVPRFALLLALLMAITHEWVLKRTAGRQAALHAR
jgi:fucose permease